MASGKRGGILDRCDHAKQGAEEKRKCSTTAKRAKRLAPLGIVLHSSRRSTDDGEEATKAPPAGDCFGGGSQATVTVARNAGPGGNRLPVRTTRSLLLRWPGNAQLALSRGLRGFLGLLELLLFFAAVFVSHDRFFSFSEFKGLKVPSGIARPIRQRV